MSERLIVWLSTNRVATWLIKHVASRLDPLIFRATNGCLTSFGPPAMPMLTITVIGRRTGRPRSVQLAAIEHEGDYLVVASAMGQEKHPAWRYNLEANPDVQVQMRGERFAARARVLSDAQKQTVWSGIRRAIPQMNVYEKRTERNIRVFRLSRVSRESTEPASGTELGSLQFQTGSVAASTRARKPESERCGSKTVVGIGPERMLRDA